MPEKKKKFGIICKKEDFENIRYLYSGYTNHYEIVLIDISELKKKLNIDKLTITGFDPSYLNKK